MLGQCPISLQESIVESLDFMLTENPVGAGLFLSQQGGRLTVAEVVYGGASASAGQIRVGDRLLGIGDTDLTESFTASEIGNRAYRLLSASPGTKLQIRFARTPTDVRTCEVVCGGREAQWAWSVLSKLDPNPWRMKLRTAIVQSDLNSLKNLSQSDFSEQNDAGLLQLANALVLWDRSNESIRFMQSIQEKFPDNFWLNQLLGSALLKSSTPPRPEASARYLTAAVALRPKSVGARLELSQALATLGDKLQAGQQQAIARQLSPKFDPDRQVLVSRNQVGQSDRTANKNANGSESNSDDHLELDRLELDRLERGRRVDKSPSNEKTEASSKYELNALELRCTSLARSGQREQAMSLILQAEKDGGDPRSFRRAKAIVLLESKDYLAAKIILAELVKVSPQDHICRLQYAFALSELGDTALAVEQCEAALRLQPDFERAHELRNVLLNR